MQLASRTANSASHSGLSTSYSHGNTFLQTGTSRNHCGSRRSAQRAGAAAAGGAVAVPTPLSWACAKRAASRVEAATVGADSPAAGISASLRQLQHSASSLDAEPTVEGLLTAFQQLSLIQKQLQQESRQCKLTLFRLRRGARKSGPRVKPAGAAVPEGTPAAAVDEAAGVAQAQLAALNQLRAAADDAQDFLLSLVQQLLQDQPPSACSQLLTSSAFRKLNVEALNRLAVNTFVDKQADASPQDMAGLMAALALVRCCSSFNQVAGFERSQLSTLFSGIMSHLLAHVGKELQQQQQQQQQQQPGSAEGRRRRQPAKTAPASAPAAAAPGDPGSVDADAIRQQVAAALAAHVSARVPFNSTLAPHVLHILQDKAPKWLHTIADVEAAPSISQLAALMSHASRYDYTLLAAAFNRLAELSEQQQAQLQADPHADSSASGQPAAAAQQQQRLLVRALVGRMQQLQADATGSELPVVLTAAVKLGVQGSRFFSTAATNAVSADNLSGATDAYLAAVMYAVAASTSSSSSGMQAPDLSRQQQHKVLWKCLERLVQLVEQQEQQHKPWSAAAAAAAAITGATSTQDTAAASALVQPSNALMALWAAASAGLTASKHLRLTPVFDHLVQPSVLQQLTSSSSSSQQATAAGPAPDEVARSCGTVLWAASQLGFDSGLDTLKPYAAAFMDSARAVPVPCGSILTVVLSLATVLNRQQQQQQQEEEAVTPSSVQTAQSAPPASAATADLPYWRSIFLQCSQEVICSLQQQQHDHQQAANSSSNSSSDGGVQGSPADGSAAAAAASLHASAAAVATQLLWAYDAVGLRPSHEQLEALMQLTQEQAPQALVQLVWQHILAAAETVDDVHQQLQRPASVSAMADLDIGAAVLQHLATLQQHSQAVAAASGSSKAVIKDCRSIITEQLLPTLQGLAAPAADSEEQMAVSATAAESAATVMWSTAQLQHRHAALAAASLQVFVKGLDTASAPAAAAVLAAMSEAGRAVSNIYSCDRSTLHTVVTTCTSKVLQSLAAPVTADGSLALAPAAPAQLADVAGQAAKGPQHASALAGLNPAVLAQKVLQLHVTVGLQPSAEHTFQLLSLVASESNLERLRDNAAAAAVVASLSVVAELSQLPGWQGIRSSSSSQDAGANTDDSRQDSRRGRGSKGAKASTKQQLQFPWAWQCQQQQLVEELWHQLLLGAFLPRISSASAKQVASALEAVVQLAGQGGSRAAEAAVAPDALDIGLAKDVARAVLDVVAPQTFSSADTAAAAAAGWRAASAHTAAVNLDLQHEWQLDNHAEPNHHSNSHAAGSASSTASASEGKGMSSTAASSWESDASADFLSAWRPGEWKGEHLASLAAAIAQLEVSRPAFFAAVEAILLGSQQAAAVHLQGAAQRQKGCSRVASVQLQHVVEICCAAAALQCRVEQLLTYAVQSAIQQLQEPLEASTASDKAPAKQQHKGKVDALEPELLLLLSWGVAVMDVPQLAQQAQQLAAAAINALKAGQAGAVAARHGQQADWELPDALVARVMQLHVWLMDSHTSGAGSMNGSDSRRLAGLSDVLSSQELQAAAAAWKSLQQQSRSPANCMESVRTSLGRLLHQPTQTSVNATTADAVVLPDVTVVVQGVPVAVLLLGDVEEGAALQEGDLAAAAAAESLAADWAPTAAQQGPRQPQQGKHSSSTSSSQRVQAVVSRQHLGDVMFRAKALAHRGFWVEVISSRQWLLLEGHLDAQEEFLRERLWPLVAQAQLAASDAAAAEGSLLDAAAVPQAV